MMIISKFDLNDINRIDCYNPVSIANYFINLANRDSNKNFKKKIDFVKLIKLVYIAHGWTLYKYNYPLIDEAPEAWVYGPVIPSVYHSFKHYGQSPVKKLGKVINFDTGLYEVPPEVNDRQTCGLLEEIWDTYKSFSATDLADLTHMPHTAWYQKIDKKRGQRRLRNEQLSNEEIFREFQYWGQNANVCDKRRTS